MSVVEGGSMACGGLLVIDLALCRECLEQPLGHWEGVSVEEEYHVVD